MTASAQELKTEAIGEVLSMIDNRLDKKQAADVRFFVERLYDRLAPDDILGIQPENLYGSALSLFKFAALRKPNTAKVRAFSPTLEEHGWRTSHSVIEIVNDDMPFLVDSVTAALNQRGINVHLVIHPIYFEERDKLGQHVQFYPQVAKGTQKGVAESYMHLEVDEQSDPKILKEIETELQSVLEDVRVAVADWRTILDQAGTIAKKLKTSPPPVDKEEVDEGRALLEWMVDNHFTFLGFREYTFTGSGKSKAENWQPVEGSGLGI